MLVSDFDVVASVTDGRQAIETARQVNADAIVLDITMPGFDGFETMRALERAGSRAAVVFLSMLGDDEHVAEAFRLGGRGYVLKSYMLSDLPAALDQVLLGRRFVPSLTSCLEVVEGSGHAMHVHHDDGSLADALSAFLALALHRGDAICVIGTEPLRQAVGVRLRARGWNVGGSMPHGRYRAYDAEEVLNDLMRNGLPVASRLAEIVKELEQYRRDFAAGPTSSLAVTGTLAGLLAARGNVEGAIGIEHLWTELTRGLPFITVCGYSMSPFHDQVPDVWSRVTGEHSVISHASDV